MKQRAASDLVPVEQRVGTVPYSRVPQRILAVLEFDPHLAITEATP